MHLDKQFVFGANPGASGFLANGMTTSGSTSFNVTPSETQDFYKGLLEPVEPQTLALFKEQGIADEILFYLFTEKVVEERAGVSQQNVYLNDRLDPTFDAFHHYVELAMEYGLSAEPTPGAEDRPGAEFGQVGQEEQRRLDDRAADRLAALFQSQGLGAGHAQRRQPPAVRQQRENGRSAHRHFPRSPGA